MKISYNWLKEYLPKNQIGQMPDSPQKMGEILTSVGLEVEGIEKYEEISNNLEGLFTGEVLSCEKHPDADKLKVTRVDIGTGEELEIVCGADNVAAGQKVIVATIGTTLYPTEGEPFAIKKAKIRGVQSSGMICAEDEIGLSKSHDGIMVLPPDTKVGMPAGEYFQLYTDYTIEIGLTPNRMDAMSHLGVAKDVCAYLSHHQKRDQKVVSPYKHAFSADNHSLPIEVEIEDAKECIRYAGVSISGIKVDVSPKWLQNKLKSIGLKPLNNIVDITNYILHETGQPLHAFDADKITGNKVIVKTLANNTPFITLDEKERKLSGEDIMICEGEGNPMCIAGVFGGAESGVSQGTVNIFLESAVFNPGQIRKSLLRHDLRTEAAIRFEKGVDVSNTVNVLKRAALLIKEIAGGSISSDIVDVYPVPVENKTVTLTNHYLKKISGKNYSAETVKNILTSLNFSILREGLDDIQVEVPLSNPDITLPADIIEEIMRIDGFDNIEIPATINMAPAIDTHTREALVKEKVISWLNGNGFNEIFTNSITNSDYFGKDTLQETVKIINGLSVDLDVLRPSMLPTGLECLAYNINRKNNHLLFLEFGKTYAQKGTDYSEKENLALYFTGNQNEINWNNPVKKVDIYYVKGICTAIFNIAGLNDFKWTQVSDNELEESIVATFRDQQVAKAGKLSGGLREQFSIKQPVYFLCIDWEKLLALSSKEQTVYKPIAKFPQVHRDLSVVLDRGTPYQSVEELVNSLKIKKLISLQLFDVFESEKLGTNKKSFAISFTFSDKEKTLVDKEIDGMMNTIIDKLEKDLQAEIRRNA
ncbi:MAG: phenylalanine--tRNA ligase subunit beta [Ginsengibacter sp.]